MKAKVLEKFAGNSMGLFCESDGSEVRASKVVDITELCPCASAQAILEYSKMGENFIVQLNNMYTPYGAENGSSKVKVFFFYHREEAHSLALKAVFAEFASGWGLSALELAEIVLENAPNE